MLPQDLTNLLAVAIRDVIWYRDKVRAFLRECGVGIHILEENPIDTATVKLVPYVLERLDNLGDHGAHVSREILTRMYYWKDMHTIPADRKDRAIRSLKEYQKGYDKYKAQRDYQEETERKMHEDRLTRGQVRPLDHSKLQSFRDVFDSIHSESDPQKRGNRFQDLMNQIFDMILNNREAPFDELANK